MSQSPTPSPKPTLPPFWKWLMRITFAVTMVLFIAPAFYALRYYAVDRPQEEALVTRLNTCACVPPPTPDALLFWEDEARDVQYDDRTRAIEMIGRILRYPGVNFDRPIECLAAKATLADLATKDPNPTVRAVASNELGKVAQGGAVIRR